MRVTHTIAKVAYWSGVTAFFYWLNRARKRTLTFHHVLPDRLWRPGVANGVSCSESAFKKIILECAKRYGFSTDLQDTSTLTITFDDGYFSQYSTAFKVLSELNIPAYLFYAGDVVNGPLTIDLLLHWVDEVPAGEYVIELDGASKFHVNDKSSRRLLWRDFVWPRFLADSAARGRNVLSALDKAYPIANILMALPDDYRRERLDGIPATKLEEMRKRGWKIGWHTKDHYPLGRLSEDEIRDELSAPPEFRDVCLSYPYGGEDEVGKSALQVAEEMGYPCAVSNTWWSVRNSSKYFLPRMSVPADRYLLHFELSGLKHFLKTFKLLPMPLENIG